MMGDQGSGWRGPDADANGRCAALAATVGDVDGLRRQGWRRFSTQIAGRRPSVSQLAQLDSCIGWLGGGVKGRGRKSGRKWQCAQSRQGTSELVMPRPGVMEMQDEATGDAGDASGPGEEVLAESVGCRHRFAQADARGPAGQINSVGLDGLPSGVGRRAARGQMV